MKTAMLYITKSLSLGLLSSGFYMTSNIVAPLKTEQPHFESHIPRMTLNMVEEMSPSFAALEDDYYVADFEEEKIPSDVKAIELAPGHINMLENLPEQKLTLPQLSMNGKTFAELLKESTKSTAANIPPPSTSTNTVVPPNLMEMNVSHHWLEGKIELSGGLAITSPRDQIKVGWMVDGELVRAGTIDIQNGTYEIKVDAYEGELVAELLDAKGFLMGEAIVDLEAVAKRADSQALVVKNVNITIEAYQFGVNLRTALIYNIPTAFSSSSDKSLSAKGAVAGVNVRVGAHDLSFQSDKNGNIQDQSVSKHSTGMITASHNLFRDTLLIADFEKQQNIRMFPEKFMKALFDTMQLEKGARDAGVIWGMVNKDQVPVAGYHVRVMNHPELLPVYFNMYIASKDQQATSIDGQYVFVGMPDGEYEIEVFNNVFQKVDSKLVSVKAGFVSQAEFDVGARKNMALRPFDPLSTTVRGIELVTQGSDDVHSLKTEEVLKIPMLGGSDPFLIYTRPVNAKADALVFASRGRKFLDVPVLNPTWWEKVQAEQKIVVPHGVIVGFIDTEAPFEVFVDQATPQVKILYFNRTGEILSPNGPPQVASGFIITGAGQGLKTLILQSESGWLSTELAYLDGQSVSLLYKAL